jgi:choline kinase|tara:strand:+ start:630 stop:1379 length:750 start_codon:yes stop_codon:yes gene_type:complete
MTNLGKFSIVLLSAGIGKRIGKIGKAQPKCLLKINGKSLIKKIINELKKREAKEINLILGYKAEMIIESLKDIKGIKFNFIRIKDFKKNGHGCSWHAFKDVWAKKKLPILLLHTDIFFNPKFLDNILKSKKSNIIGIHSNHRFYKKKSLVVDVNSKYEIKKINYIEKQKDYFGEVIGINKISKHTSKQLFKFMDKFLVRKNKRLSWEIVLDNYINKTCDSLFVLKNQNYAWTNINYYKDFKRVLRSNEK